MLSPWTLGSVTTRRSTRWPSTGEPEATVLWQAPLGDVEVGHDLHARRHAGRHPPRHGDRVVQHAVDAEADAQVAPVG